MTTRELIETFCSTQDIEIFKKLPQHTQNVFQTLSKFAIDNNVGYLGLAYIILNYMNNKSLYKKPKFIYGVHEIHLFSSEKYNMKVLVLGDSHNLDYICSENYVNQQMSVVDFITQEIINSDSFIDLYLELPYILKDIKIAPILVESYIRRTQLKFDNCFTWSKTLCQYPHLRAHYTDLRSAVGNKYFLELIQYTARIYFDIIPQNLIKVHGSDIVNNKSLEKIFETKETLIRYVQDLIMESKIGKQIDNIKDPILREKVLEQINIWIETPNDIDDPSQSHINWDNLKWSYIQEAINTNNKIMIDNIYSSLAAYSGVTMDAYLLSRMFRNYTSIKNKNSSRATNIILYAGSYHTNRYMKFLKNILHFTEKYKAVYYGNCVNISSMKLPIFSSKDILATKKPVVLLVGDSIIDNAYWNDVDTDTTAEILRKLNITVIDRATEEITSRVFMDALKTNKGIRVGTHYVESRQAKGIPYDLEISNTVNPNPQNSTEWQSTPKDDRFVVLSLGGNDVALEHILDIDKIISRLTKVITLLINKSDILPSHFAYLIPYSPNTALKRILTAGFKQAGMTITPDQFYKDMLTKSQKMCTSLKIKCISLENFTDSDRGNINGPIPEPTKQGARKIAEYIKEWTDTSSEISSDMILLRNAEEAFHASHQKYQPILRRSAEYAPDPRTRQTGKGRQLLILCADSKTIVNGKGSQIAALYGFGDFNGPKDTIVYVGDGGIPKNLICPEQKEGKPKQVCVQVSMNKGLIQSARKIIAQYAPYDVLINESCPIVEDQLTLNQVEWRVPSFLIRALVDHYVPSGYMINSPGEFDTIRQIRTLGFIRVKLGERVSKPNLKGKFDLYMRDLTTPIEQWRDSVPRDDFFYHE